MRSLVVAFLLILPLGVTAQVQISSKDLTNLVRVSEIYSTNPNLRGVELEKSLGALRTPKLDSLIDTLLAIGKGDGSILADRFLKRPNNDDLYLWYVVREIHYNNLDSAKGTRPNVEIARETLAKVIDTRWLLDNYYYRIRGGIAMHFNDADLSNINLRPDKLGLKDKTERAIFFFNVMEAVGGGRFMVLLATRNYGRVLEFANRFPLFNGKKYYTFRDFDYADFDWIGYKEVESYNSRHLNTFYTTLIAHYRAETEVGSMKVTDSIFRESILSEPKYFQFSNSSETLRSIFESANGPQ